MKLKTFFYTSFVFCLCAAITSGDFLSADEQERSIDDLCKEKAGELDSPGNEELKKICDESIDSDESDQPEVRDALADGADADAADDDDDDDESENDEVFQLRRTGSRGGSRSRGSSRTRSRSGVRTSRTRSLRGVRTSRSRRSIRRSGSTRSSGSFRSTGTRYNQPAGHYWSRSRHSFLPISNRYYHRSRSSRNRYPNSGNNGINYYYCTSNNTDPATEIQCSTTNGDNQCCEDQTSRQPFCCGGAVSSEPDDDFNLATQSWAKFFFTLAALTFFLHILKKRA